MSATLAADEARNIQSGTGSRLFFNQEEAADLVDRYTRALGRASELLNRKDITDIYRNPGSDVIWYSGIHGKVQSEFRQSNAEAERFVATIVSFYNTEFGKRLPYFEGVLPFHGGRFTATTYPFTSLGTGWIVRLPIQHVPTLQEYVDAGIIESTATEQLIRKLIVERQNVLIGGEPGAGKTTLLNAMLAEIVKLDKGKSRFGLIEDCDELRCNAPDHVKMMVDPAIKIDGQPMDWGFAIKRSLRLSLTRIMLGEIRSHASVALDAWRTGHRGNLASIHGGDPHEVMARFEFMLQQENFPIDRHEIARTVNAVIVMRKVGAGARVVSAVKRISGANAAGTGYLFT